MNAQNLILTCFIVLYSTLIAIAQSPQAFVEAADKAFEKGDYYSSMKYLERSLEMEPDNNEVLFKHGEAAKAFEAYSIAEVSYERVLSADGSTYPNAYLGLGRSKQALGKYEAAYKSFQTYLELGNVDLEAKKVAAKGMEDCEWALEQYNRPATGVIIQRLADDVNTPNSDFGAVIHNDTLYYSSFKEDEWGDKHFPKRPIVRLLKKDNNDSEAEPSYFSINNQTRHTAHTSFHPNDNLIAFNQCDYIGEADVRCQLFIANRLNNDWSGPIAAPFNIEGFTTTQPSFGKTVDGQNCLYFVSDREGGKGGLDIWYAVVDEEGTFGEAVNLEALNTAKDDITPYFDFNQNILYFSTNGLRTLGGFDIYQSKLTNGVFGLPSHMDIPVNSSGNDLYFVTDGAGDFYFSSNRKGSKAFNDEICCYDIYQGEYLEVFLETFAFEKTLNLPLDKVVYTISEKSVPLDVLTKFSGDATQANFDIERSRIYQIIASKDGYRPDTIEVITEVIPENRKFIGKLYLEPIDLSLEVLTYNQIGRKPLSGVNIRLIEMEGIVKEEATSEDGENKNQKKLTVRASTPYLIVGTLKGFSSDSVQVSALELKPGAKLSKNLFLTPGTLGGLLPLSLYFDNDEPDKRTTKEVTTISYDDAFATYFARKNEFVKRYTKGLSGEKALIAGDNLESFFEHKVRGGFLKLENFADNLDLFLENGYQVEVMVKGYASPLANSDYNLALTKRRIVSVLNYFRKVRNGLYGPYLATGQFMVTRAPFGETTSPIGISDKGYDRRKSVFSVEASLERRAEIIEIRLTKNRSLTK